RGRRRRENRAGLAIHEPEGDRPAIAAFAGSCEIAVRSRAGLVEARPASVGRLSRTSAAQEAAMRLTRAVWLTAVAAFLASPAAACMGDKVLFEDHFDQANPGWGKYLKDRVVIGGGAMKVTPQPKRRQFVQYRGDLYGDVDVCVDITVPARNGGAAGLLFG